MVYSLSIPLPPFQKITLSYLYHPASRVPPISGVMWLLNTNLLCMYETEQILYSFLSDRFKK